MKAADRKHGTKPASAGQNATRGAREAACAPPTAPPSAPAKPSSEDRYWYKGIALLSSASCLHRSGPLPHSTLHYQRLQQNIAFIGVHSGFGMKGCLKMRKGVLRAPG